MMELEKAKAIAEKIKALLESSCDRVEVAGSIRRQKPEVGDIELLCIPKYVTNGFLRGVDMLDAKIQTLIQLEVLDYRLNKLGSKVYGPKNKLLVHLESGIGVDIFSATPDRWPVALFVRTGGKITNKRIAAAAIRKGWRFHAYGRGFTTPDGEIVCHSEHEIFKAVGLPYLPPEERR